MAKKSTKKSDTTHVQTMVQVEDVKAHPSNPRIGDLKRIKKSIQENGFLSPIVVQQSTMYVIAGNHRLKAARELGISEVPAFVADIDDDTAEEFLLADNKTSDEAHYDESVLAALLSKRGTEGLSGTGYTKKEANTIIARAEWQSEEEYVMTSEEREANKVNVADIYKNERPDEREEILEALGRRSMVLSIPMKKHEKLSKALKKARADLEVDTNEELIVSFLQQGGYLAKKFVLFEEVEAE